MQHARVKRQSSGPSLGFHFVRTTRGEKRSLTGLACAVHRLARVQQGLVHKPSRLRASSLVPKGTRSRSASPHSLQIGTSLVLQPCRVPAARAQPGAGVKAEGLPKSSPSPSRLHPTAALRLSSKTDARLRFRARGSLGSLQQLLSWRTALEVKGSAGLHLRLRQGRSITSLLRGTLHAFVFSETRRLKGRAIASADSCKGTRKQQQQQYG